MLISERHSAIEKLVRENNIILIGEISSVFNVSLETARRDLETLQDKGIVRRIHGGAVLASDGNPDSLVDSYLEKRAIGIRATSLINNGDTIFLDVGSTTLELARNLRKFKSLTVITNSIPVINELLNSDIRVIVLGGDLNKNEQFIYSYPTEQMMSQYFVDKAFFSCGGLTFTDGLTDYGNVISRDNIAHQSRELILLVDSGKFGRNANVKAGSLDRLNKLVVDSNISKADLARLQKYSFEVIIADTKLATPSTEG